ncbi:hypothetical protein D3C83_219810 [compost metagenome]
MGPAAFLAHQGTPGDRFGDAQHGLQVARQVPPRIEHARTFHPNLGCARLQLVEFDQRFF